MNERLSRAVYLYATAACGAALAAPCGRGAQLEEADAEL
jgi:hypothetical protein